MESRRNLRVLPSNAPTLAESEPIHACPGENLGNHTSPQTCPKFNDGLDCRICGLLHACSICLDEDHHARTCISGVPRVSSDNIGSSELAIHSNEFNTGSGVHYTSTVSHSLIRAPDYSNRNAIKLENRKRQRRLGQRAPEPLSRLPLFYRSELLSPRYNAYREKSRSKGANQKWPDHIEEAFQEALRLYPCRGRKKEILRGELKGGNEFITAYIKDRTGADRDRKQVSSHIQTLKNLMPDNDAWMSLVVANGFKNIDGKKHGNAKHEDATSSGTNTSSHPHYTHLTQNHCLSALPSSPAETLGSNQSPCAPTIRRVEFAMVLYKRGSTEVIHTYTSIQCVTASAPWPLEDLKGWRTLYPALAECYEQGQIDCPIFLFDTSLSLMEDPPGCNALLAIESSLDIAQGASYHNWQCLTRFYEEHGHPVDLAKFYKGSKYGKALRPFDVCPGTRPTDSTLRGLPLKSDWWVTTFSKIIGQNLKARATKDAKAIKIEDENTERYIRGISVMQEIYASTCAHGPKLDRVAILVWKFSKSRKCETATTSWRRLIPPMSPFQVQSPTPPQVQPLPTLDTTLQNSMGQRSAAPYADYCNNPGRRQSMFADNAEELLDAGLSDGSSRRTTPPSDYNSFPSSTSTLFPSNISNPGYPLHLSQESSFQYQDSAYASLSSFSSQESQYHTQDLITNTEDVYESQSDLYHTQEALYHSQTSAQLYDWSTAQPLLHDDSATAATHDFIGGKIQISYPAMHDVNEDIPFSLPQPPPPPTYQPHLFAPRATMPAQHQHQLLQHPEHFEQHDYNLEPELVGGVAVSAAEEERVGDRMGEEEVRENGQQCAIDWQLITEQPLQVVPDPRFQDTGMEGKDGGGGEGFVVLGDEGAVEGRILGEVVEAEENEGNGE